MAQTWVRWTAAELETLRQLHAEGWTGRQIAQVLGRTLAAVQTRLLSLGLGMRPVRETCLVCGRKLGKANKKGLCAKHTMRKPCSVCGLWPRGGLQQRGPAAGCCAGCAPHATRHRQVSRTLLDGCARKPADLAERMDRLAARAENGLPLFEEG